MSFGGIGGSLVRYWRARMLGEGQRVSRREMWRRLTAIWAQHAPSANVAEHWAKVSAVLEGQPQAGGHPTAKP